MSKSKGRTYGTGTPEGWLGEGRSSYSSGTNRERQAPGNINWSEVPQRSSLQHQDPSLSNCLQTPVLDASGQTTSKTGIQPQPSHTHTKMKGQKNMLQMKEQDKNLQDQINEKEIGNPPEKEFRVMIDSKDDPKSQEQNGENTRNI